MKGHEGLLTSVQKDGLDDDLLEYIHELETKHLQQRNQPLSQGEDSFYNASYEKQEPQMEDPRSYDDLEKENIDLKEQMIH